MRVANHEDLTVPAAPDDGEQLKVLDSHSLRLLPKIERHAPRVAAAALRSLGGARPSAAARSVTISVFRRGLLPPPLERSVERDSCNLRPLRAHRCTVLKGVGFDGG